MFTPSVDAPTKELINWPTIFSISARDDENDDGPDDEEYGKEGEGGEESDDEVIGFKVV